MADTNDEKSERARGRRGVRGKVAVVLGLLAVAIVAGTGAYLLMGQQPDRYTNDSGATISEADPSLSDDEIRKELDRQAEENMMTLTMNREPRLDGNRLEIGFVNSTENKNAQAFKIYQDGNLVYTSGSVEPGSQVDSVDVDAGKLHTGKIECEVVAVKDGREFGNAGRVSLNVV